MFILGAMEKAATLKGKRILLGVTGSIAAYKAVQLVRLLIKQGAEVRVVMTPAAAEFVTPLTFATLSRHEVHSDIASESAWHSHVELGLWADLFLIAPLTANTMAKMAAGLCDNLLTATYLSARCPVFLAPAMDLDMWKHPATRKNLQVLQERGHHLLPVGYGELASGLVGEGRMAEPEEILAYLEEHFRRQWQLVGKRFLVTAGPTYEPLDPVRFIGNYSSGKMGVAIAESLAARGAHVRLLLGPSDLSVSNPLIELQRVQTAEEMHHLALERFDEMDGAVLAAAVADYRPKTIAPEKIKKSGEHLVLELEKNPDIAASLGQRKQPHQILVGFALETENERANALEKLKKKNFDFIVLNSLRQPGAGFHHDTNQVTLLFPGNKALDFELKSKAQVAEDIVHAIVEVMKRKEEKLGRKVKS